MKVISLWNTTKSNWQQEMIHCLMSNLRLKAASLNKVQIMDQRVYKIASKKRVPIITAMTATSICRKFIKRLNFSMK